MHAAPPIASTTNLPVRRARAVRSTRGARLLRTASYLSLAQLAARVRFMLQRRIYALAPAHPIDAARQAAAATRVADPLPALMLELIAPEDAALVEARASAVARGRFCYLRREADYSAGIRWRDPDASPLWLFNLQYLGALLDLALTDRVPEARHLLAAWSAEFGQRWDAVAWHPYPVSLRLTNICFAAGHLRGFDALGPDAAALAAAHAAYLLRHLEHDLRGNHLLENACALLVASAFLHGPLAERCGAAARAILAVEIPEQVQADGSHFELSPMYQLIVLQRCLQALALLDPNEPLARATIAPAVTRMARCVAATLCPDGDFAPLGDAARGFAPPAAVLLAVAERFTGVTAAPAPLGVTAFDNVGLHVFRTPRTWAIFDAGPVCADYLPGHGQADSLTVEVWCDGACVVGDPGVHEYTGPERAWGRSSRAHSTLTVDDADTSEVYGSFRVGGRARIVAVTRSDDAVTAALEPFGVRGRLTRMVRVDRAAGGGVEIVDAAAVASGSTVRSRLHLHPAVQVAADLAADARSIVVRTPAGRVRIDAEQPMYLEPGRASREYGLIEATTILVQPLVAGAARFSIVPLERG